MIQLDLVEIALFWVKKSKEPFEKFKGLMQLIKPTHS